MPQLQKFIGKHGTIEEGLLLTPEEVKIIEDPLFETLAFNTAVKGSYYSASSINNVLTYILTHFNITRRAAIVIHRCDQCGEILDADGRHSDEDAREEQFRSNGARSNASSISDNTNVCDQCGEVLDDDGLHTVDADTDAEKIYLNKENTNA